MASDLTSASNADQDRYYAGHASSKYLCHYAGTGAVVRIRDTQARTGGGFRQLAANAQTNRLALRSHKEN